jgi:DNA-binding GntR family transcriptional regulator
MNEKFLYLQVYKDLKNSILSGQYKTGSKLPSENELCEVYKTTRLTVRQAFDELIKEGFVYKEHGRGTFVKSEMRSLGLLSFKGFSEVVGQSHQVKTKILQNLVFQSFPKNFSHQISEEERLAGCIYLERLRFADETPVMLEHTYLPDIEVLVENKRIAKIKSICDEPLVSGSLFKTLHAKFQIEVVGLEQAIRAIESEKHTAELLKMQVKKPILYVSRRYTTNKANFFIYSTLYCNTDKYSISNTF